MTRLLIRLVERLPFDGRTKRALVESLADHYVERGGGALAMARVVTSICSSWRINENPFRNIGQDLRSGSRRLRQAPMFTLFSVVTLALGIGATTAIYAVIQSTLYQPLNIQDPDRVMNIYGSDFEGRSAGWQFQISLPDFQDLVAEQTMFSGVAAWARVRARLETDGQTVVVFGETVTANYFEVLGVRTSLGRPLQPADDQPNATSVIVLSDDSWRRYFNADPAIVGRVVKVQDMPFVVVGVTEPSFRGVDMPSVMPSAGWISLSAARSSANTFDAFRGSRSGQSERDTVFLLAKGRLKAGVTREMAGAELATISARLDAAYPRKRESPEPRAARYFTAFPSTKLRMHESIHPIAGVFAAAAMTGLALIVIAGTNLANLQLGRLANRKNEIAVRLALGASRWRVMRALAVEGLVLSTGGLVAGLFLAGMLIRWMTTSIDVVNGLVIDVRPEIGAPAVVAATLCALLSTLVAGLIPAWHATRSVRIAAAGASGQAVVRWRGRRAVIAAQVAVSIVLLGLASVFGGTAIRMRQSDPGIDYDRLVAAQLGLSSEREPERVRRAIADLTEQLRRSPEVQSAFAVSGLPIGFSLMTTALTLAPNVNETNPQAIYAPWIAVAPEAIGGLGFNVKRGRGFTALDLQSGASVCLIGERTAQRLFGHDPIGSSVYRSTMTSENGTLKLHSVKTTIVGVVADVDVGKPGDHDRGIVIVPIDLSVYQPNVIVVARMRDGAPLSASWMRDVVSKVDRTLPLVEIRTGPSLLKTEMMFARVGAMLTSAMGMLAALLAIAGLSGVLAHMVASRVREIGVRIALGARASQVIRMVLADGLKPVLAGLLLGIGLAWLVTTAAGALVTRFGNFEPAAGAAILGLMLGAGIVASLLPARRASRVDPNVALREL